MTALEYQFEKLEAVKAFHTTLKISATPKAATGHMR
jgi:hypothetical protein